MIVFSIKKAAYYYKRRSELRPAEIYESPNEPQVQEPANCMQVRRSPVPKSPEHVVRAKLSYYTFFAHGGFRARATSSELFLDPSPRNGQITVQLKVLCRKFHVDSDSPGTSPKDHCAIGARSGRRCAIAK
nr:hypothetical protein CFP56_50831 [Quercus suber]